MRRKTSTTRRFVVTGALAAGLLICLSWSPGAFGAETPASVPAVNLRMVPGSGPYHRDGYYVLHVPGTNPSDITWPDPPRQLDGLLVDGLSASDVPPWLAIPPDASARVWRLTALKPGTWKLPSQTVRIRRNGQEISLPVPSVLFEALPLPDGVVPKEDDLEDPVAPEMLLQGKRHWWVALVALAIAVSMGILLWCYRYASSKPIPAPPPLPPWETALRRLEELRRRNWPMLGKVELYYVDLSAILRYYIQDRFNIDAPEMTTEECVEALGNAGPDNARAVEELLRHFDRVKFAGLTPGVPVMEARLEAVADFVRQTTPTPLSERVNPDKPGEEGE